MREVGDPNEDQPAADPVGRARAQVERVLGGRPLSVYGVLAAGVLVLVVLLVIIWVTATGGGENQGTPLCAPTTGGDARLLVDDGRVRQIDVFTLPDNPQASVGVRLELDDDTCYELPQGVANQTDHLFVVGAAYLYNNERDSDQRIRIRTPAQENIAAPLLETATPPPTVGPTVTPLPPTQPPGTPVPPLPTAPPSPTATAVPPPSPLAGSPMPDPTQPGGELQTADP